MMTATNRLYFSDLKLNDSDVELAKVVRGLWNFFISVVAKLLCSKTMLST